MFKDKLKAFLLHLTLSIVIIFFAYLVVYHVLYPAPLDVATDISSVFIMMLIIDVILGPALTFVVYKKAKKTLKFDLAVIALIQLSALGYGMYSMHNARPVWISYVVDRFELVQVNNILDTTINPAFAPKAFGIDYAFVSLSQDSSKKLENFIEEAQGGISPAQRLENYRDISNAKLAILDHKSSLDMLQKYNSAEHVQKILQKYPNAVGYLPLKATAQDMTVLVDKDGQVIKIVNLRPW